MDSTYINPMELIDLKELMRVTGMSRPTIYRRIADGTFKPVSQRGQKLRFRRVTVIKSMARAEESSG